MWRIANDAMLPGMIDDVVLNCSMMVPSVHPAFALATNSPERPTTQAAHTGEDVETLSMLLESA